jgi:hypothetical protein
VKPASIVNGRTSFIPFTSPVSTSSDIAPPITFDQGRRIDLHNVVEVPLVRLCLARSGDKGDSANIGVVVRKPEYYSLIVQELTEKRVSSYMQHLMRPDSVVKRYLLPGSRSINFVITRCLGK